MHKKQKHFTAQFSDLSGPTNPTGILSPAFLALKLAIDRGDAPDNVLHALYDWLSQKNIEPTQVNKILELEPAAAYEALVGLIGGKLNARNLPTVVQQTLQKTIQLIARRSVQSQEQDIAQRQQNVSGLKSRYGVESAPSVVRRLLGS